MELKKAIFADLNLYKNSQCINLFWILFLSKGCYINHWKIGNNILYTWGNMFNVCIQ